MLEPKKRRKSAMAAREEAEEEKADWSGGIPDELLRLIAEKIESIKHYIAFGAVCKSWYSAVSNYCATQLTPWLMLAPDDPPKEGEGEGEDSYPSPHRRGFYSFSRDEVFDIELPEIKGKRCWGSPFGWLITVDYSDLGISLFNPLSRASIPLPNLEPLFLQSYGGCFKDAVRFMDKAILTASPNSPGCIVAILYIEDMLGYAKPGESTAWTLIPDAGLFDITYFQGNLYGCIWNTGQVVILDLASESNSVPVIKPFAGPPLEFGDRFEEECHESHRKKYLVDVGGELCLVFRYVNPAYLQTPDDIAQEYYLTYDFEIYKIDLSTKVSKGVTSLGDYCLFMGTNSVFAVRVCNQDCYRPNRIRLKPNCIYFLDDNARRDGLWRKKSDGSDMGVFHVGEFDFGAPPLGDMKLFYDIPDPQPPPQPSIFKTAARGLYSDFCPPLWITPCLKFQELDEIHNGQRSSCRDLQNKNKKQKQNIKASSPAIEGPLTQSDHKEPHLKITLDIIDKERDKLKIQLKHQFTFTENHGVDREPWRGYT